MSTLDITVSGNANILGETLVNDLIVAKDALIEGNLTVNDDMTIGGSLNLATVCASVEVQTNRVEAKGSSLTLGNPTTIQGTTTISTGGKLIMSAVVIGSASTNVAVSNGIAIGINATQPSGLSQTFAINLGTNTITRAVRSIAIGDSAEAASVSGHTSAISIGSNSDSFGFKSVVIGADSLCSGTRSIGIGSECDSLATNSIAIGSFSLATASYSTAIGGGQNNTNLGATARATNSIAIGRQAETATGVNGSVAIGRFAQVISGTYSIAIGGGTTNTDSANANGASAIAVGQDSLASSTDTVAIGHTAQATATRAIAIGMGASTTTTDSVRFANPAPTNNNADARVWDQLFQSRAWKDNITTAFAVIDGTGSIRKGPTSDIIELDASLCVTGNITVDELTPKTNGGNIAVLSDLDVSGNVNIAGMMSVSTLIQVATPNNANAAAAGVPLFGFYIGPGDPAIVYQRTI